MRKKNLPQAIAEDLIIPFALKIAKHLLSSETQKKSNKSSKPNHVIRSRIKDTSEDILNKVTLIANNSNYNYVT